MLPSPLGVLSLLIASDSGLFNADESWPTTKRAHPTLSSSSTSTLGTRFAPTPMLLLLAYQNSWQKPHSIPSLNTMFRVAKWAVHPWLVPAGRLLVRFVPFSHIHAASNSYPYPPRSCCGPSQHSFGVRYDGDSGTSSWETKTFPQEDGVQHRRSSRSRLFH